MNLCKYFPSSNFVKRKWKYTVVRVGLRRLVSGVKTKYYVDWACYIYSLHSHTGMYMLLLIMNENDSTLCRHLNRMGRCWNSVGEELIPSRWKMGVHVISSKTEMRLLSEVRFQNFFSPYENTFMYSFIACYAYLMHLYMQTRRFSYPLLYKVLVPTKSCNLPRKRIL